MKMRRNAHISSDQSAAVRQKIKPLKEYYIYRDKTGETIQNDESYGTGPEQQEAIHIPKIWSRKAFLRCLRKFPWCPFT